MYLHSSLLVVDKLSPLWAGEDVQVCCGLVRHEGSCTNSNGKDNGDDDDGDSEDKRVERCEWCVMWMNQESRVRTPTCYHVEFSNAGRATPG